MKEYKQNYEPFFTSERSLKKCRIDQVSAGDMALDDFVSLSVQLGKQINDNLFDLCLKLAWLRRKFHYFGVSKKSPGGHAIDTAYSIFTRFYVGHDLRVLGRTFFYPKIISYIDEWFPNFINESPFETKYEFPYKNIGVDFVLVVYQMEERTALLELAEKRKMTYSAFLDFVMNYILSYNDECKEAVYTLMTPKVCTPYVRANRLVGNKKIKSAHIQ